MLITTNKEFGVKCISVEIETKLKILKLKKPRFRNDVKRLKQQQQQKQQQQPQSPLEQQTQAKLSILNKTENY